MLGCTSTKPPPAPAPAVAVASRTATQAAELSERQNWTAAAREWKLAVDRFALLNDRRNEAIALHNLAHAQLELGHLDEAHRHLEQAAGLNEKLGHKEEWWRNQIALLQVEARLQQTNELRTRFEKLTPLAAGIRNRSIQGLFLNETALWHHGRSDFDQAAEAFEQARRHFEAAADRFGIAAVLANRAQLYERQQDYPLAIETWQKALASFESVADPRGVTRSLAGFGRTLLAAEKDFPVAEDFLRRAARNYHTLNFPKELNATLELLEQCLKAQGKEQETKELRSEFGNVPKQK